jgi:hypothetical protein
MRNALLLGLLAVGLTACGEYKSQVPYENGGFEGKRDVRVWDQDKYGHMKEVWVEIIHDRNMRQNEYRRTDYQE